MDCSLVHDGLGAAEAVSQHSSFSCCSHAERLQNLLSLMSASLPASLQGTASHGGVKGEITTNNYSLELCNHLASQFDKNMLRSEAALSTEGRG